MFAILLKNKNCIESEIKILHSKYLDLLKICKTNFNEFEAFKNEEEINKIKHQLQHKKQILTKIQSEYQFQSHLYQNLKHFITSAKNTALDLEAEVNLILCKLNIDYKDEQERNSDFINTQHNQLTDKVTCDAEEEEEEEIENNDSDSDKENSVLQDYCVPVIENYSSPIIKIRKSTVDPTANNLYTPASRSTSKLPIFRRD